MAKGDGTKKQDEKYPQVDILNRSRKSALAIDEYYGGLPDMDMGMHSGYVRSARGASVTSRHDRAHSEAKSGLGAAAGSTTLITKAIRSRTSSDGGGGDGGCGVGSVRTKLELYRVPNGSSSAYTSRRTFNTSSFRDSSYSSSSASTSTKANVTFRT